jgi:hypothetical protein
MVIRHAESPVYTAGYSACDLIANDGFDTVGADKNIPFGARAVIEEQFDLVGLIL